MASQVTFEKIKAFMDAETPVPGTSDFSAASVNGEHAILTDKINVDLTDAAHAQSPAHVDTIILKGSANLNATGDEHNNIIAGNDGDNVLKGGAGDDAVTTGDGADTIMLGTGNDTIIINGSGEKYVDGGTGDDHFIILDDSASNKTFTGLNIGDRLTVTVPDGNTNGMLDFADVHISGDANSLTYTLANGSSFTLDGVPEAAATNGSVNYAIADNGDGTWTVDITG